MSSQLWDQSPLEKGFENDQRRTFELQAQSLLGVLIQSDQYVGDVYSISYETALVQIHDFQREQVGGIPSLCFLIATRINPQNSIDYTKEDASVILLRVIDAASLPSDAEAERIRVEMAQRAVGPETHWDEATYMDAATNNQLGFAGIKCQVIGTFFLDHLSSSEDNSSLVLRFGSDLSNYYPNRGLKVYKPKGEALLRIVNYRDPLRTDERTAEKVSVGEVRYASTNRAFQGISNVKVELSPGDLLAQKTALFGMTRTGKSNTTKIILKSIFELRFAADRPLKIGQIVFDQDGEYANVNEQDKNAQQNPSAIKNVWRVNAAGKQEDVVTYGIAPHLEDPNRKLMLLNFYEEKNLQIGKEIINAALPQGDAKFVQNFRQVVFDLPQDSIDYGVQIRYNRRVLAYRALLYKAGFTPPSNIKPVTKGLFAEELLKAMAESSGKADSVSYQAAARTLTTPNLSWGQLVTALEGLYNFISTRGSGYQTFEEAYVSDPKKSGEPWADENLKALLEMLSRSNGAKQVGSVARQHTHSTTTDYAFDIYRHLVEGRLVIIDQSSGDPEINKGSAERIMWHIFRENQSRFREGQTPPEIIVYVEEAHTLLPAGTDLDLKNVWVRTAKEGSKYHIGLVYATQEVSSIQRNILKSTANWFIGHLNNTDETKELSKYYDFAYFEASIRRAQDKGFLRMKTLSNLFVVPVQIKKFEV